MKKLFIFWVLISVSFVVLAQDNYIKRINFHIESEVGYQMQKYKDRIYISIGHFCENYECSSIIELNSMGDTLWRVIIPDIDMAGGTMLIHNDSITLTGNNEPFNTAFRISHYSLDGDKLGPTYEIEDDSLKFDLMFQLTTQKIHDRFYICGSGTRNGLESSILYNVDHQGKIDTVLCLEKSPNDSRLWGSLIDKVENLTTIHEVNLIGGDKYRKIIKFDDSLDSIWSYTTETNSVNSVIPVGAELKDGRLAMTMYTPNTHQNNHSIRIINSDKTIDWEYNPPNIGTNARYIRRLKVLENGDILGTGFFQDVSLDPEVIRVPWIFRMTPEGQKLWDRIFYEYDPEDDESRNGTINDVIELDNGDLMGIGSIQYETKEIIIFKVDENGCIDENNCDIIQLITSAKEVNDKLGISVYPNPASDILNIKNDENISDLSFFIIDAQANKLTSTQRMNQESSIDISRFTSGIYYVIFTNSKESIGIEKLIIE